LEEPMKPLTAATVDQRELTRGVRQ
jgi:hypothetical protein